MAYVVNDAEKLFEGVIHLTYFGWLCWYEMAHALGGACFSPLGIRPAKDGWLADVYIPSQPPHPCFLFTGLFDYCVI